MYIYNRAGQVITGRRMQNDEAHLVEYITNKKIIWKAFQSAEFNMPIKTHTSHRSYRHPNSQQHTKQGNPDPTSGFYSNTRIRRSILRAHSSQLCRFNLDVIRHAVLLGRVSALRKAACFHDDIHV
jgi:hypothetical protein